MSEVVDALLNEPTSGERLPPRILLGQFERVGSTFYLDQLEQTHTVHNEPYKLLIPSEWPIARDYEGKLVSVDDFFDDPKIAETQKHWFRNFILSLHYPGDQIVKETNLYAAVPQFLDLFPESDIELLTRNPTGVVSSFKRNGLYERWNYARVAEVVAQQLRAGKAENSDSMLYMLEQGEDWQQKLTWMIGLNAVLLSRFVEADRVAKIVSYEDDIIPLAEGIEVTDERTADSIFSTNIRKTHDDFERRFTPAELCSIREAMEDCADYVASEFDTTDRRWFNYMFARYVEMSLPVDTKVSPNTDSSLGQTSAATEEIPLSPPEYRNDTEQRRLVKIGEEVPLLWDHALITNKQMVAFLQDMLDEGYAPENNRLLLLDNMPTTRGGRIVFDSEGRSFKLAEGYDQHPAYWVSWLAAGLFAYRQGMRLPYYSEWEKAYQSLDPVPAETANHSYSSDDVVPTGQSDQSIPDDFFGNLKIWCADWSNRHAVSKKLAGISWKNRDAETYNPEGERPYLTSSRIIGARLVQCSECPQPEPHSVPETLALFEKVIALIEETTVDSGSDLSRLNSEISDLVTGEPCSHTREFLGKESETAVK